MIILSLILFPASLAFADEKVSVFVEYRHDPVHVHYSLPCEYAMTCNLTSPPAAKPTWKVEVTTKAAKNGIVSVETVVTEDAREVSRSNILTKLGEESKIESTDAAGRPMTLVVRPF